jgi:hypothetical protein
MQLLCRGKRPSPVSELQEGKNLTRVSSVYATAVAISIGFRSGTSSFSGLLARVEIGQTHLGNSAIVRPPNRDFTSAPASRANCAGPFQALALSINCPPSRRRLRLRSLL